MKKNIIANLFGRFWGMISAFLFVPLYIRYLGFANYSIISFMLIISGLIVILDAGLTATLSREFARSDNDKSEKIEIYKTLETCYFVIGLIAIIVVVLLSDFISTNWLNIPSIDSSLVSFYIKIFAFDIIFQMLFRFYMGGLLGLEKHVMANVYQIGLGVLRNAFVVIAILFFPTLKIFFIWQCLSSIIFAFLIKLSLEKTLNGRYSFHVKFKVKKNIIKRIWKFAGGIMLISLVSALNTQMDKLAISALLSLETLGYYTLAVSLSSVILAFATPFSSAVLPRFTNLYSDGKAEEAFTLYRKISLFLSITVFSIYANMMFFSERLFFVWTGDVELASKAYLYLPYLAFSMSMLAIAVIPYSIALANGYTRLNNIMGLVSLFVTLPGYWIATNLFGGVGAAIVFCIVQTITTFVYYYYINKKFIKTQLVKAIFSRQIIRPLFTAVFTVYLIQFLPVFYEKSRFITFVYIGISTGVTLFITIILSFSFHETRDFLKSNILKLKTSK